MSSRRPLGREIKIIKISITKERTKHISREIRWESPIRIKITKDEITITKEQDDIRTSMFQVWSKWSYKAPLSKQKVRIVTSIFHF